MMTELTYQLAEEMIRVCRHLFHPKIAAKVFRKRLDVLVAVRRRRCERFADNHFEITVNGAFIKMFIGIHQAGLCFIQRFFRCF